VSVTQARHPAVNQVGLGVPDLDLAHVGGRRQRDTELIGQQTHVVLVSAVPFVSQVVAHLKLQP
jgi:hypothetical protein